jgi:tripartite ATP-independent transporter DctM subunit
MISVLLIGLFFVFMMAGLPVAISIMLATIVAMVTGGYDLMSLPQHMASSIKSIELMAIPFFILAAALMNVFGMTRRIFDFADAAVGWLRGGLAQANVLAGFIFAGISGAAVADAAALGAISMKEMPRAGYPAPFSAAVVISVSTLGPIIPPSIMMVVYAITADVSIARLFIAGFGPGILMAIALMILIWALTASGVVPSPAPTPFSWRRLGQATRTSILSLFAPVVILRGMVVGWVTPTEAGVLACVYAILIGILQREVTPRRLFEAFRDTVEGSALILYIIAVSSALSYVFVAEGTAAQLSELMASLSIGPVSFLLLANLLLLILGCLIETLPAMLLSVPLLLPTAKALGIDLVHLGVVVILNLIIGIMTPPMGIGLYILMAVSKVKFGELVRACLPFIFVLLVALLVITFVPQITLWLPNLLFPDPGALAK